MRDDDGNRHVAPDGSKWLVWRDYDGRWPRTWMAAGMVRDVYVYVPHRTDRADVIAAVDRLCPAPTEP